MDIQGTIELINESKNGISSGDIIAIVVALLSLLGVVITTAITNTTTKKISKANAQLQDSWNQKNIDANLIANARIEWIQNVRRTTAELLTHYFAMLKTADQTNIYAELLTSQEKTELLCLYFGPEANHLKSDSCDREKMVCLESNDEKNNYIVQFLIELSQRFSEYSSDVKSNKYQRLEEALNSANKEMHNNMTLEKVGVQYTPDGDDIPVHEPHFEQDDMNDVANATIALQIETKKISLLQKDLIFLRDVIRIYLKIEWRIAKTGQ